MTRRPVPFPSALRHDAFSLAEARDHGITPRMLDHRRFLRPHHGVRRLAPSPAPQVSPPAYLEHRVRARAHDYAPRLRPGEAFSHASALLLHDVPIRAPEALHVTIPFPSNRAMSRGVVGHRASAPFPVQHEPTGLPCVPTGFALLQAAPSLAFLELVVALDHLRLPRGPSQVPLLEDAALDALLEGTRCRGIRRLRDARSVSRIGAESRMETRLHYELATMGLDDLELQGELHDQSGRWIGRFDEIDRARRRIIEFDGEQHRLSRQQYLRDEVRLDQAREAGCKILRLHAEDFAPRRISTTRRRLCAFLGRSPQPVPAQLMRRFAGA